MAMMSTSSSLLPNLPTSFEQAQLHNQRPILAPHMRTSSTIMSACSIKPTSSVKLKHVKTDCERMRQPPTQSHLQYQQNKPLMEKRRRQRMNRAMDELRRLVLPSTSGSLGTAGCRKANKQQSSNNKLEKAKILEMTVEFVKNAKRDHHINSTRPPTRWNPTSKADQLHDDPQHENVAQLFLFGYTSCEQHLISVLDELIQRSALHSPDPITTTQLTNLLKEFTQQLASHRRSVIHSLMLSSSCSPPPQSQNFINAQLPDSTNSLVPLFNGWSTPLTSSSSSARSSDLDPIDCSQPLPISFQNSTPIIVTKPNKSSFHHHRGASAFSDGSSLVVTPPSSSTIPIGYHNGLDTSSLANQNTESVWRPW